MSVRNGLTQRMVALLRDTPGMLAIELGRALGFNHMNGSISYAAHAGHIHVAGPRHSQRYYATADEAQRNHERLCIEADKRREDRERKAARIGSLKRRARRHAAGAKPCNSRVANMCDVTLPPGYRLAPDVRITIAATPRDRWAPEPGFERAITSDWSKRCSN